MGVWGFDGGLSGDAKGSHAWRGREDLEIVRGGVGWLGCSAYEKDQLGRWGKSVA